MRALLIFVFLMVVVWWVRQVLRRFALVQRRKKSESDATAADQARVRLPERIVACAHCGLHVPESEALRLEERFYCCEAHRQLGVSEHSGHSGKSES